MMKTIFYIFLLLLPVNLLLLAGCSKSESLYGKPENIPDKLQLSASISEADVIEFRADSSNVGRIAPFIFYWTPAEARGVSIEYVFLMDIANDYATAFRNELGEDVYERTIRPDVLFHYLHSVWKVPTNVLVSVNVAVTAPVQNSVYMKPESSAVRITAKLTE
jgi:hypothetical protein